MQSKFCDDADNLVATGGLTSKVFVWDCQAPEYKEVACFDHIDFDSNFHCLEIEWQNSKTLACAGNKSKYIYLWNIDQPRQPQIKWEYHSENIEQIQWDPSKRLLASCSNENFVCIWSTEKNTPEFVFEKTSSPVVTIKWSHGRGAPSMQAEDPLLAAGCQDGQILIYNAKTGNLQTKLDAQERE